MLVNGNFAVPLDAGEMMTLIDDTQAIIKGQYEKYLGTMYYLLRLEIERLVGNDYPMIDTYVILFDPSDLEIIPTAVPLCRNLQKRNFPAKIINAYISYHMHYIAQAGNNLNNDVAPRIKSKLINKIAETRRLYNQWKEANNL